MRKQPGREHKKVQKKYIIIIILCFTLFALKISDMVMENIYISYLKRITDTIDALSIEFENSKDKDPDKSVLIGLKLLEFYKTELDASAQKK